MTWKNNNDDDNVDRVMNRNNSNGINRSGIVLNVVS